MSALAPDPAEPRRTGDSAASRHAAAPPRPVDVCPLLRSHDAAWSSVYASRGLACWAVSPPAELALAKQRQLCATPSHLGCVTFGAAAAADRGLSVTSARASLLWPGGTSRLTALEPVHRAAGLAVSAPKAGGQALLVAVMLVALVVLVIAKTIPLGGSSALNSPSPPPSVAASALVAASPSLSSITPTPSAVASPTAAASASVAPNATPSPSATPRTYKVRTGDTLTVIAAKFHTTVKAIMAANGIADPRTIHAGQVLVIP